MNSLELYEGTIKRKRLTENRKEPAAMDLFLVSQIMLPMVVKMHVDEQGVHQHSNYHCINHNQKVTASDHAKIDLHLDLVFERLKPIRKETLKF